MYGAMELFCGRSIAMVCRWADEWSKECWLTYMHWLLHIVAFPCLIKCVGVYSREHWKCLKIQDYEINAFLLVYSVQTSKANLFENQQVFILYCRPCNGSKSHTLVNITSFTQLCFSAWHFEILRHLFSMPYLKINGSPFKEVLFFCSVQSVLTLFAL